MNEAIRGLSLTRIIVAHRPETIAGADRVIVLGGGRVTNEMHAVNGSLQPARGRGDAREVASPVFA